MGILIKYYYVWPIVLAIVIWGGWRLIPWKFPTSYPKAHLYSYHFVAPIGNPSNVFGEIIFLGGASNSNGSAFSIVGLAVGCTGGMDFVNFTCSAAYMLVNGTVAWNPTTITQLNVDVWSGPPVPGLPTPGSGEQFTLTPTQIAYSQGNVVGTWQLKSQWCRGFWVGGGPPLPQPPLPPIGAPPSAGEFNDPPPGTGC
jgi:hypothetical protein